MLEQRLNRHIAIPLYYQLKELLLSAIRAGDLKPGAAIPTEFELVEQFQISRNVVRQAIGELVKEGYLIRKKAKGTFVSTPSANIEGLKNQEAFRETVMNSGQIPASVVLSTQVMDADVNIAQYLSLAEGTRIIAIRRLRLADEKPVSLSMSYLPFGKCVHVLEHRLEDESLHHVLGLKYDTRIYRSTKKIEARLVFPEEALLLKIPENSVVQCVTRQSYNRMNAIIEATLAIYRGDFELSFETVEGV